MEAAAAFAAFALSHVAIARSGAKAWAIRRFGRVGYLVGYSALSLALLAWLIDAVRRGDRIFLWQTPDWAYPFAVAVNAIAFALIGAGAAVRNPLSVSLRDGDVDPDRPTLIGLTRHPLLLGLGLWGVAHAPANGDWPSLLLFGGSALFAALGMIMLDRRVRRRLGDDAWRRLAAAKPGLDRDAALGVVAGLALFAALLAAHPYLFGVDPLALTLNVLTP